MFAKLFERDSKQVLVKLDADNEKCFPEVRFYFEPEGFGVCSVAVGYKDDSDKSWDSAEKFFNEVTEEKAMEFADKNIEEIIGCFSGKEKTA